MSGQRSTPTPHANGVTVPIVNGTSSASVASKHNLAPHFIGGNHLDVAPPGRVKDFVANNEGHTVITSVSIWAEDPSAGASRWLIKSISGAHRQQRHCCRQGDQIGPQVGLRDLWRRASDPVHGHGDARGPQGQCGLHPDGGPVRRGVLTDLVLRLLVHVNGVRLSGQPVLTHVHRLRSPGVQIIIITPM